MGNGVSSIILAGGSGKRMDILCHGRPKPALPFAGQFKVIDFCLSNCIHSGIYDIAVLVDYQRNHLKSHLNNDITRPFAPDNKLHILEPRASSYKGTADAIYQNLEYIWKSRANRILVLAADHIYQMDYRKMLAFHESMRANVTIGVITVPIEQANRFGIVTVNKENKVIDFIEKPAIPTSNLASMGIYIFNRDVLKEYLIDDAAQADSSHDFGHAIIPKIVHRENIFAYKFDGYWKDIGTIQSYYEANMEFTHKLPPLTLNGKWPIYTKYNNLPFPKISQQDFIKDSLISPGCVIRGKVENSILSPGVIVKEQAIVRNSVIMASTTIGKHSVVDHCILDEEVNIGEFCYLGLGHNIGPGSWDITILGNRVTVPSYTALGRNCKVLPGIESTDFMSNAIPAGDIVSPSKNHFEEIELERILAT